MKIHVDKIPPDGLELQEKLDSQKMLLDLGPQGISFPSPIDVKANVAKLGSEVFIDVELESPVEYMCSRCLAKFQDVFKKSFNVNYEAKPGNVLDVDEDIRQEIMLDYPMKLLCRPDCKGLCPNCGQNLNIGECECNRDVK